MAYISQYTGLGVHLGNVPLCACVLLFFNFHIYLLSGVLSTGVLEAVCLVIVVIVKLVLG